MANPNEPVDKLSSRLSHLVLPHSTAMEQSVLGSMLSGREALAAALSELKPDDFYDPKHRLIFQAVLDLNKRAEPCDVLTVSDVLEASGDIGRAGGYEYLATLQDKTPILSHYPHYIAAVRDYSQKRRLIFALDDIIGKTYQLPEDASTLIEMAAQKIYAIREAGAASGFELLGSILTQRVGELEERARGLAPRALRTHFPSIDALLGGLRKGGLYVLAARPGVGKSSLALNIAHNVAAFEKKSVAIFSLEMSKEEVATRILISQSLMPLRKLESLGAHDMKEWKTIADTLAKLYSYPIYIEDRSAVTATEIHARCRQLQMQDEKLELVIVDYLQLMGSASARSRAENRQQQIAEISRMLKVMARELKIPVIALSQLNREIDKTRRQPRLADLRESGAIEQDADVVMFLHPPTTDLVDASPSQVETMEFIVEKNRQGETGKVELDWKPSLMTFYEPDEPSLPPPAF